MSGPSQPTKRRVTRVRRRKLRCRVCSQVFDKEYREKHNKKYHQDLIKRGKPIPYEAQDVAGPNPFILAKKRIVEVPVSKFVSYQANRSKCLF